jgi:hypothetical protein
MEDLELGWRLHSSAIMDTLGIKGKRPWGWWAFEACEDVPAMEPGAS